MAAVVRLKRLLEEEPLDALVINCKRRKTEPNEPVNESIAAVLKFAGTVKNEEEDILKHIKKPTKAEIEKEFKQHNVDIVNKLRQEAQCASKESRYNVINCYRANGTDIEASSSSDLNDSYTVFDIELKENNNDEIDEKDCRYVYDLYYTNSDDFGEAELNELVSIYPLSDELIFSCYHDTANDTDSYDSEDSNAECNWRNDYPDEESDPESVTEEDMLKAINRMNVDEDSDLSSDEGEEKYVYNEEDEEDDINQEDVRKYGKLYAKFKAKSKKLVEVKDEDHNFYIGGEDDYYE